MVKPDGRAAGRLLVEVAGCRPCGSAPTSRDRCSSTRYGESNASQTHRIHASWKREEIKAARSPAHPSRKEEDVQNIGGFSETEERTAPLQAMKRRLIIGQVWGVGPMIRIVEYPTNRKQQRSTRTQTLRARVFGRSGRSFRKTGSPILCITHTQPIFRVMSCLRPRGFPVLYPETISRDDNPGQRDG